MTSYTKVCGNCNTSPDILWFCNNCPGSLCGECKQRHLFTPMTKHHVITPLFCEVHSGKLRTFHCHDCHQTCCESCLLDGHYGHSIVLSFSESPERNGEYENIHSEDKEAAAPPPVNNGRQHEHVNSNGLSARYIPSNNFQRDEHVVIMQPESKPFKADYAYFFAFLTFLCCCVPLSLCALCTAFQSQRQAEKHRNLQRAILCKRLSYGLSAASFVSAILLLIIYLSLTLQQEH